MKLTKKLIEQMIEEAVTGTYNPVTGELGSIGDEEEEFEDEEEWDEEEGLEGDLEVVGHFGGKKRFDREMKQPAGPGIQIPRVRVVPKTHAQGKPIERHPPDHPLAGKPVTQGPFDQMTAAAIERERTYDDEYRKNLRRKGYTAFEESKFKMTKNDIVEMIKEEITNILNGD